MSSKDFLWKLSYAGNLDLKGVNQIESRTTGMEGIEIEEWGTKAVSISNVVPSVVWTMHEIRCPCCVWHQLLRSYLALLRDVDFNAAFTGSF